MSKEVSRATDLVTRGGSHCVCSKCHMEKPLNEDNFHKSKGSPTGYKTVCKECKRQYYKENKEHRQKYQLEYARKNKAYYDEYRKHYDPEKGGAGDFNMREFRKNIIPEVDYKEKLIYSDGTVKTKDGREFTRLIGAFGEDKPIFTIWQVSELLGSRTDKLFDNLNRNIDKFEIGIDYIDLKEKEVGNPLRGSEIHLRDFYHKNRLNATKQWVIFSQSGLLKMIKISNTKESWDIYENFIEDYFKTKVELIVAENNLKENIKNLEDTKKILIGSLVMETDEAKKIEIFMQLEKINNQIRENEKTLIKEETIKQFEDIITIAEKFTNGKECFDIGLFSKALGIKEMGRNNMMKWMREEKILKNNNEPYQNMMDKFNVIKVEKNERYYTKTLLKPKGVKFLVEKLKKQGYIENISYNDILNKLTNSKEVA